MKAFKKKLLLLGLVIVFLFVQANYSKTYSQSLDEAIGSSSFDTAFNQYLLSVEGYNQAYEDYILKRSRYLSFKTLRSQQDAQEATALMLRARDDVVISYLYALRSRLSQAVAIPAARKESLIIRIDEEVSWFVTHKEKVTSAGSLNNLVVDSNGAKERFIQAEALFYEVLAVVSRGKIISFTERSEEIFLAVKIKVDEIRADKREGYSFSSKKFAILDRWLLEAQNLIERSKESQLKAEDQISQMAIRQSYIGDYSQILSTLRESQLYLRETSTFLEEVIREIKTAEE